MEERKANLMKTKFLRAVLAVIVVLGIALMAEGQGVARASGIGGGANQSTLAILKGFVWNDADRDGVQDVGETGIRNVAVNLYDSTKTLVSTTRTDANGRYLFENLTPGDYYVDVVAPAGYAISPKDRGGNKTLDSDVIETTGETIPATLVAGENSLNWDAGLHKLISFNFGQGSGSVKPPPSTLVACENGFYSVGGVATIEIKDLKPGYCIEAVLWNPRFQIHRLPDGVGAPLAHMLFLRVYLNGRLVYDVPSGDGTVETCYSLPPDKQAQFYFYDFYGKRFNKRTELPRTWDTLETTIDDQNKTACAFTQVSGVYGLIGK